MNTWLDDLVKALPSVFSGGGITGGATLAIFGRLIATEKLWFNRSVQRVIDEKDKQLGDLRVQTDKRVEEMGAELGRMKDELARMTSDRDYWRSADESDKARADAATNKLANEFLPLMQQVNRTFGQFTRAATGQS